MRQRRARAGFSNVGIGCLGVSLAFGLTVMTPAYTLGHISSGHLNPAVSSGLLPGGRFDGKELSPYWVVQVAGVIAAADVLYFVMSGAAGFEGVGGFGSNVYGEASPQGWLMTASSSRRATTRCAVRGAKR